MKLKETCENCSHWDHIEEMGQFGDCWHNVKDPTICPFMHKDDTCILWASRLPQHTLLRMPVTYVEYSPDPYADEQIVCADFSAYMRYSMKEA